MDAGNQRQQRLVPQVPPPVVGQLVAEHGGQIVQGVQHGLLPGFRGQQGPPHPAGKDRPGGHMPAQISRRTRQPHSAQHVPQLQGGGRRPGSGGIELRRPVRLSRLRCDCRIPGRRGSGGCPHLLLLNGGQ